MLYLREFWPLPGALPEGPITDTPIFGEGIKVLSPKSFKTEPLLEGGTPPIFFTRVS